MANVAKLKVFRTAVGFHDAYVAAPSQRAALEAWGAAGNLFAQGLAEAVEDPELIAEPLARPGEVVKRLRGSAAEQMAAAAQPARKGPTAAGKTKSSKRKAPRPSRDAVERAEAALADAQAKHAAALAELRAEEQALDQRRREVEAAQQSESETLLQAVETARGKYRRALAAWADA